MKTLHLIGFNADPSDETRYLVAKVSIESDGKLVVASTISAIRADLERDLGDLIARHGVYHRRSITTPASHQMMYEPRDVADPDFLQCLTDHDWFWVDRFFGGYRVNPLLSYVVDDD
ncbi:MAG: hypothetical protein M3198_19580 [Actinomycetota bacterium]|nr:hypothetical protein [Actinomycetota bacterium]